MAEYKLKPCPFCGCDMKIETVSIDFSEISLLVGSPKHNAGCMMGAMPTPRSKDVDKLVESWNKRDDTWQKDKGETMYWLKQPAEGE